VNYSEKYLGLEKAIENVFINKKYEINLKVYFVKILYNDVL